MQGDRPCTVSSSTYCQYILIKLVMKNIDDTNKFTRLFTLELTAEQLFVVNAALNTEHDSAYEHGPEWERIVNSIQLPISALGYEELAGPRG